MLERVRDLPWFFSVRGNHEEWLQDSLDDWGAERSWRQTGGTWADGLPRSEVRILAEIVNGLPVAMALPLANGETIGLIHTELSTWYDWEAVVSLDNVPVSQQDDHRERVLLAAALWGRRRIVDWLMASSPTCRTDLDDVDRSRVRLSLAHVAGVDLLIVGYSVVDHRQPFQVANLLWIDTGSFQPEGHLAMVQPLTRRYWQAAYRAGLPDDMIVCSIEIACPSRLNPSKVLSAPPTDQLSVGGNTMGV